MSKLMSRETRNEQAHIQRLGSRRLGIPRNEQAHIQRNHQNEQAHVQQLGMPVTVHHPPQKLEGLVPNGS